MSYILDALRKADAQRQAGMASSLQSGWDTTTSTQPAAKNNRALAIALLTLAVLAAGAAVAWLLPHPPLPTQPAAAQAAAFHDAMADVEAAAASPPPLQAVPEPSFAAEPPGAEAVAPELPPAPPVRTERSPEPPAQQRPAKTPPPAAAPANATATLPQPTAPEASNYHSLPTLRELPAALRQAIPPLTLGGYIYSSKQAERSILINNRLHQEGDELAPNLRLESMTPEELILNYQGKRFRQAYSSR